jgi:HEAT repeat protein
MTIDPILLEQARSADSDTRHRVAATVAKSDEGEHLALAFELLGDRDWRVRKAIVEGFLQHTSDDIIRGLILALHDDANAGKRNSATEALIRIGQRSLEIILREFHQERDPDVRLSLVNLLGDLRSDDGLTLLLHVLEGEHDINVLSSAVASVGKYRDSRTIPKLLELLRREDLWLKFHVVEALGHIGDRAALPSILPLYAEPSLRKPVLEAVGRIADVGTVNFLLRILNEESKLNLTALRALIRIARSDKPRVIEAAERQIIQRMFRESFPKTKIDALVDHLVSTPKRDVKNFILTFLGWSGDARATRPLLDHLQQPESADLAAQALIDLGPVASQPVLEALQNSDDDEITALLIRIVNMAGGPEAIPTILQFLDHDNAMIRRLAIEALGEILETGTVDYLLAKLDDSDVGCQQAAVNSASALVAAFPEIKNDTLAKIRRLLGSSDVPTKLNSLSIYVNIQGEGYHDELLLASKDEDAVIRQKAISLMGKFSDERFADTMVLSLADESTNVRLAAIEAIQTLKPETGLAPLISSLEDTDIWLRTAAAQALGEYRDAAIVEPLVRHLETDVTPVKIAVIDALGKSESEGAREALLQRLDEADIEIRKAAILALSRIPGDTIFERLSAFLLDPDWRLRAAAALALGQRGDERALGALHHAMETDPDTFVRQSVVAGLEKMASRSSFPWLLAAIEDQAVLDEISHLFVKHKETYRDLLEDAWRHAGSRHEVIIAAILQSMRATA